ncbi:hypothetical protein TNCV_4533861 [Trichonephila clavipes]|nr:hypothetical protein TNCV_4533861 [Trichonephila clavipes]
MNINVALFSSTMAFGDAPRNFEPGQVTWIPPELAPPLQTTTPTGGLLSSRQIIRVSLSYKAGLYLYWARIRVKSSHDLIPIPLGYRGHSRG